MSKVITFLIQTVAMSVGARIMSVHARIAVVLRAPGVVWSAAAQHWQTSSYLSDVGQLIARSRLYAALRAHDPANEERSIELSANLCPAAQAESYSSKVILEAVSRRGPLPSLGARPAPTSRKSSFRKILQILIPRPINLSLGEPPPK